MSDETHHVYSLYDNNDRLLYVGCTNHVQARVHQHRSSADWFWQVDERRTTWRTFLTRREALDEERRVIGNLRPKYNRRYTRPEPPKPPRRTVEVHGYALRVIREARGRTMSSLAAALDVDRSYIAHMENGTKRAISRELYSCLLRELAIDDYRALLATAPARETEEAVA